MTTIESLLSWESSKLESISNESGDVAKLVNAFKDFLATVAEERLRFSEERSVLAQQIKVIELNSEQRQDEMERQVYELSSRLQNESDAKRDFEAANTKINNELLQVKKEMEKILQKNSDFQLKLQQSEADTLSNKSQLEDALRRLQHKENEMVRLNSEWGKISEKEAEVSKLQAELRAKLSDVDNRDVALKFREDRLSQEKDIVTQQNSWLTEELTSKTDELSKLRQTSSETICKLQSELAEKTEEAIFLTSSNAMLKHHSKSLDKRVNELVTKLQEKDADYIVENDNIRLQLNKQERLSELYNNNCEEYQSKIKDLTTAIEEMQNLLKTTEESRAKIEDHYEGIHKKDQVMIADMENKISNLQNELEHANNMILTTSKRNDSEGGAALDISQLSSTAATVGGMMKSGMTITQIYSAYVEATESLALEKDKNRLQTQYLDQILKEIEEKAPLLQQQRIDYENALMNQDDLANKLEKSMIQVDKFRVANEESINASKALKRENDRYKTQIKDISQQVQVLLKELEDTRAGRQTRAQSPSVTMSRGGNSSQVISDQLVNFRSIGELQQQNAKLLAVVRELSEEQERREMEDEDPKLVELRSKLHASTNTIKELKEAQQGHIEMVEAVARQRDMYRVLLSQAGHNMGPVEDKVVETKDKEGSKHELALSELQKEFSDYKKEKQGQVALVQEQLDNMRNEHSSMLTEKTRLASKLDFSEEKYKILENTYNNVNAEVKQYKDKVNELSSTVLKLQLTNDRLTNESLSYREEVTKLSHSLESQRKTNELLKASEIKQRTQNESLIRESRTQNMLLSNLQSIQNNLERQQFDNKERTDKRIASLESELSEARRKLQSSELRFSTTEALLNTQIGELKTAVEKEKKLCGEHKECYEALEKRHAALLEESAQVKMQVQTLKYNLSQHEKGTPPVSAEASADESDTIAMQAERLKQQASKITELQHQVIELNAREESLKSQVELAKQHAKQYKDISEAHEMALNELSQSEQSSKTASEELLAQNKEEIAMLTQKLKAANAEQQQLQAQLDEYHSKGAQEMRELSSLLKKTQLQLEDSRHKEESSISLEHEIRRQFNNLTLLYEQSQSSLLEQKTLVETFEVKVKELESQVGDLQTKYSNVLQEKTILDKKLIDDNKVWETARKTLESDRDSLNKRVEGLQQQNTLLHTQLESLSKNVVELQKALVEDAKDIKDSNTGSNDKTTEELWEIIRYVRREKDILTTKIDVSESEVIRYKNRCDFLEKQIEETKKCLDEERSRSDRSIVTTEKHKQLLKKVEETQAITEKLKLITEEKNKLSKVNMLLKQQIGVHEKQQKPLKTENRELTDRISILEAEKETLKKDVTRWSERANELIEQCNRVDAKELERLQAENSKLKLQVKKKQEEHTTDIANLQQQHSQVENENSRLSEEKKNLLNAINSMKAEGTKNKIELNNVTAELKSLKTITEQHKAEIDKVKADKIEIEKKHADQAQEIENMKTSHQENIDKHEDTIMRVRALARKYKEKSFQLEKQLQATNQTPDEKQEAEKTHTDEINKIKKASAEAIQRARIELETHKHRIEALSTENKELESKVAQSNSNANMLKAALESEKSEKDQKEKESSDVIKTLQDKIDSTQNELTLLRQNLEDKQQELDRVSSSMKAAHVDKATEKQIATVMVARSEETPTASVRPTNIVGISSTPTAAVRPTSIAPDVTSQANSVTPRMIAVTPTTSTHLVTTSGSTPIQVSSSSPQSQTDSGQSDVVNTGEVRGTVRSLARSRDEVSSGGSGYKRSRADVEDDEQPGPSTKIAMVTSSAHISSKEAVPSETEVTTTRTTTSEHNTNISGVVSSSEVITGDTSSRTPTIVPDHVVSISPDTQTGPVTSSEASQVAGTEREFAPSPENNEALPTYRDEESSGGPEDEDAIMRDVDPSPSDDVRVTNVEVIDVASDTSEESTEESNEDVYSGLDEVEVDSRQLQFSVVSGTDPTLDILTELDENSVNPVLDDGNNEAAAEISTANLANRPSASSTVSLRPDETPWAHLAVSSSSTSTSDTTSTQASPSTASSSSTAPSSSSNITRIRRIKRLPARKN